MTRVLGIDPGSRATGWAVLEARGARLSLTASGVIRPRGGGRAERLAHLYGEVAAMVERERPDTAAVETPFSGINARSALALAESRGVILAALGHGKVPVASVAPASVKSAVVGSGQASKEQVVFMVVRLLGLRENPPRDAADAMAVAIAHWRLAAWVDRVQDQGNRVS